MNCETVSQPSNAGEVIARMEAQLTSRFRGRIRFLQILLDEGSLTLHGRTTSFYVKQLIQHAVMRLTHIPIRANAIVVES